MKKKSKLFLELIKCPNFKVDWPKNEHPGSFQSAILFIKQIEENKKISILIGKSFYLQNYSPKINNNKLTDYIICKKKYLKYLV